MPFIIALIAPAFAAPRYVRFRFSSLSDYKIVGSRGGGETEKSRLYRQLAVWNHYQGGFGKNRKMARAEASILLFTYHDPGEKGLKGREKDADACSVTRWQEQDGACRQGPLGRARKVPARTVA